MTWIRVVVFMLTLCLQVSVFAESDSIDQSRGVPITPAGLDRHGAKAIEMLLDETAKRTAADDLTFTWYQTPGRGSCDRSCQGAEVWLIKKGGERHVMPNEPILILTRRGFLGSAAALAAGAATAGHAASKRPPNVVWIWADNLAYGDLEAYGNTRVKTPAFNRLAQEGARFNQFYVAHTVCSPSRAALLTGRQPFRCGIIDVLRPDGPSGLPADEITLAEALRDQGYATAAFGKWHLGDRTEFLPLQHGFDTYFGLPYSMDMLPTVLYRGNEIAESLDGEKVSNITERLTDAAIDFIGEQRERPFFVYFSHTLPHPPINLPNAARNEGHSAYEDAIEHLDFHTGRILGALDAMGLAENTLVVYSSDNGPMDKGGSAGELRGRIRDAYEGGVRVPFAARWPGVIPAGRVVETPAIMYDIFPTLLGLADADLPSDRVYDVQDIAPLLTGEGTFSRDRPFVWVYLDRVTALRDGNWKLHVAERDRPLETPLLYDLETDPGENNSLTADHPDVVEKLTKFIAEVEKDIPKAWGLYYPVRDPAKRPGGVRRE